MLNELSQIPGVAGAAGNGDGTYRLDLAAGGSRQATAAEVLAAAQAQRIAQINAECRARLIASYGTAEEQVSRSLGIYGTADRDAMIAGIADTIDASNVASNAVLAATTIQGVEAVTVTWPAI